MTLSIGKACWRGGGTMEQSNWLTSEERDKITEMQDLLIDRYVEQKRRLQKGEEARVREIELEIKELKREIEEIKRYTNV
jgi:hypothetical protein